MKTVAAVLVSAVLVALAGCGEGDQQAAAQMERPPAAVFVAPAVAQDVPLYIEQIGRTAPRESVVIQPQVTGKITAIHFTDGAEVKNGELLFTIDPRPYEATVKQVEATLAQSRADVKWAQSELKRVEGLSGTGAISAQEVESKQNAVAVAEAKVQAAEATLVQARLNLDYCSIASPIDGRAGQRLVDIGNVVSTGGADGGSKLLTIQRIDPIYADFTVPEQQLPAVREHMALGTLRTQVWLPANPQQVAEGQLTFLDNLIQQGSGTVKLRATLPNKTQYFWPGQFVNVRLVLTVKKDAVLVPAQAAQVGQDGQYVFVVTPEATAELRPVQVGQRQGALLVIEDGLKAGEQVVTQGHMSVMPGGKVQVIPATTQPAPAAPAAPAGAVAEGASKS